jgi:peptidoglycan/LPS O-acetylase OafA/YrhL
LTEYKKNIDGLRAIAVGSVILYHASIEIFGIKLFPGGYLGVDIFFIISGYLITSIIVNEFETTNNFSLINFFDRRIRRIFPALLLAIIIFLLPAFYFLISFVFVSDVKSINSIFTFSTNYYYSYINQQYGAESSLEKPFLHTWSIAIEFQFYLFISIFFLLAFKYFKKFYLYLLILFFLISLIFSQINSGINSISNFYLPYSRFWEFIAGCFVYFLEKKIKIKKNFIISNLPLLNIFLILLCFIYFNHNTLHPSILTLILIINVGLLILFANQNFFVENILTSRIFSKIGLLSYSLYIFHYPLFSFARIIFDKNDNENSLIIIKILLPIFLFFISLISYEYVEKIFRNKKVISFKIFYSTFFSVIISILCINFYIIKNNGFNKRWVVEDYHFDKNYYNSEINNLKKDLLHKIDFEKLKNSNLKKILVFGNSHGNDLYYSFSLRKDLSEKYIFYYIPRQIVCLSILVNLKTNNECLNTEEELNKYTTQEYLKIIEYMDVIIISSRYYTEDIDKLDKNLKNIKKFYKKKIIITTNTPQFTGENRYGQPGWTYADFFIYNNKRYPNENELKQLEEQYYLNSQNNHFRIPFINIKIKEIANKNDVEVLDLYDLLCNSEFKKCKYLTNNKPIYRDYGHFAIEGLNLMAELIFKKKNNLFGP